MFIHCYTVKNDQKSNAERPKTQHKRNKSFIYLLITYISFILIEAKNHRQAHREDGVRGLATSGPTKFGGPAVCQKYKIYARMYQFEKKNSKIFFP